MPQVLVADFRRPFPRIDVRRPVGNVFADALFRFRERRKPVYALNGLFLADVGVPHHRKTDVAGVTNYVKSTARALDVDQRIALIGNAGIVRLADGYAPALGRDIPLQMGAGSSLILVPLWYMPERGLPCFRPCLLDGHAGFIQPVDIDIRAVKPVCQENADPGIPRLRIGREPKKMAHHHCPCDCPTVVP